ncbi:MAG TPA: glucosaminidase domain-containing protein, partial [Gammaproteobacteria bacterium]|nr:glucosaminidase domain-containing protein [Gammaproteobacteria bacterium]
LLELIARLESATSLGKAQTKRLKQLARTYRVEGNPLKDADARATLISRVDSVPASLALAQAANESAWGKSRFAREGNNLFGIWTYDEDKGIVPLRRAPGKKHLVRKFDSIGDSVRYYLHTLNSHPAYASLREIRAGMRANGQALDALMLAGGLTNYSARGEQYVELIRDMIRRFELAIYDAAVANEA